jgi:hypothetical protein
MWWQCTRGDHFPLVIRVGLSVAIDRRILPDAALRSYRFDPEAALSQTQHSPL